jgi:hypothetical protein
MLQIILMMAYAYDNSREVLHKNPLNKRNGHPFLNIPFWHIYFNHILNISYKVEIMKRITGILIVSHVNCTCWTVAIYPTHLKIS